MDGSPLGGSLNSNRNFGTSMPVAGAVHSINSGRGFAKVTALMNWRIADRCGRHDARISEFRIQAFQVAGGNENQAERLLESNEFMRSTHKRPPAASRPAPPSSMVIICPSLLSGAKIGFATMLLRLQREDAHTGRLGHVQNLHAATRATFPLPHQDLWFSPSGFYP